MSPLGISTAWNAAALHDGEKVLEQILRVGFRSIEFDYRLSEKAIPLVEQYIRDKRLVVSSIHNFAPLPSGEEPTNRGGDKLSLAAPDDAERQEAVELTKKSVDLARRLGARAVVIHAGHVDLGVHYFQELSDICKAEGVNSERAKQLRDMVRKLRKEMRPRHIDSVTTSLKELVLYLGSDDITLCIENRYFFHQIPLPVEVLYLIDEIGSPRLRYWHDIGHAHVLEAQGWLPHLASLDTVKQHMFGVHIHDSIFTNDHIAPGTGEIDFGPILERVPPEALRVLELSPKVSEDEVALSLAFLGKFGLTP
jgi:sugar phosphate isomerase/epimerase